MGQFLPQLYTARKCFLSLAPRFATTQAFAATLGDPIWQPISVTVVVWLLMVASVKFQVGGSALSSRWSRLHRLWKPPRLHSLIALYFRCSLLGGFVCGMRRVWASYQGTASAGPPRLTPRRGL